MKPRYLLVLAALIATLLTACGGGSSPSSGSAGSASSASGSPQGSGNVQPVSVNLGIDGGYANGIFTSVTVCIPGTATCQTIPDILVDTGSDGLRIVASALNGNMALPAQASGSGYAMGECLSFADGYSWGAVVTADVRIAGETASALPIQVIGAAGLPNAPTGANTQCIGTPEDSVQSFGANGVLGIGVLTQDCGSYCASTVDNGQYFTCSTTGTDPACSGVTASVTDQVQNPVPYFATDNNGVMIQLPVITAGGQATASGSLVFGIGTEANNALGSASVLTMGVDDDSGVAEFQTTFQGTQLDAFIDSGSNLLVFNADPAIATCASNSDADGFYCPSTTQNYSATLTGANNQSATVSFSVANATSLFSTGYAAFNDLAGPAGTGDGSLEGYFDWGLPFFYGRDVFFAVDGSSAAGVAGPYVAF